MGLVVVGSIVCFGCEKKSDKSGESPAAVDGGGDSSVVSIPDSVFVDESPGESRSLGEVKADLAATGEVVIEGRIGGRRSPFVEGMAVFVLADSSMKSCDELHGDSCKTPWDYCCEAPDSLASKIATIQVVGEDGKPLRTGLEDVRELTPGARLVIAGEVLPREDTESLVINARRIFVR
jgi:hypothetical protein